MERSVDPSCDDTRPSLSLRLCLCFAKVDGNREWRVREHPLNDRAHLRPQQPIQTTANARHRDGTHPMTQRMASAHTRRYQCQNGSVAASSVVVGVHSVTCVWEEGADFISSNER